jgi:general secretion pathway protein K
VVLINVLVILALSSTIVFAMLRLSETGIIRSQSYTEAGQALALLDGGEISAIAALRRDMRNAPQADHPGEDWAGTAQADVAIEGGRFGLVIADTTARFNLNNLAQGRPEDLRLLQKILVQLTLPETAGLRILARMADPAPLDAVADLTIAGLSPSEVAQLQTLVTALPGPTAININTMPDAMFAVLAANPVQARLLQGLRARKGQLTTADLLDAGLILGTQVGVTSAYFTVTIRVTTGRTAQARESLLARLAGPHGPDVRVITRRSVP